MAEKTGTWTVEEFDGAADLNFGVYLDGELVTRARTRESADEYVAEASGQKRRPSAKTAAA